MNGRKMEPMFVTAISIFAAIVTYHILWLTYQNAYVHSEDDSSNIIGHATTTEIQQPIIVQEPTVSSVWCRGRSISDRICRFRNLCYQPAINEFVFFHHPTSSVIYGLPEVEDAEDNFHFAALTSVKHLNTHHFRLTHVPAGTFINSTLGDGSSIIQFIGGSDTVFFLRPFKPDNLMHVLHDDLLPLFATLQELCYGPDSECFSTYRLVTLDHLDSSTTEANSSPYLFLYSLLTGRSPIRSSHLAQEVLYCFRSAVVGISRETVWYQYGFHGPQGPTYENINGAAVTIRNFVRHISATLGVGSSDDSISHGPYAVLFTRHRNRLVLNEAELEDTVSRISSWNVTKVGEVNGDNLAQVIRLVIGAEMIVGMHGAALALGMFLRAGRLLIELFPYAVPADRYTPYRTMARLPSMDLIYSAWENTISANTVTHPHRPPNLGGIDHLPEEERERINKSTCVRLHKCCSDPEWLFRIYQDTYVDVDSFEEVLTAALDSYQRAPPSFSSPVLYRMGAVRNLTCVSSLDTSSLLRSFLLSWDEPWNVQFLPSKIGLRYEIWSQLEGTDNVSSVLISTTNHLLSDHNSGDVYNCWVRGSLNNNPGPMEWVVCS